MFNLFRIVSRRCESPFSNPILITRSIHAAVQSIQSNNSDDTTSSRSILSSLHGGHHWKSLSEQFGSFKFSNAIVQEILLELKEPIDSRKALSFFHWSSNELGFHHGVSSYCIMIHILTKARLFKDAKALLDSVLTMEFNDGKSPTFHVLDLLLESYKLVDSVPYVFELFVQICAKLRLLDDILDATELLSDRGFSLSLTTFNTVLHVMQKSDKVHLVWHVYKHMVEMRTYPNDTTVRIMVSALCKQGKLEKFLGIVDRMHGKRYSSPRLIVNTCLVYEMIEENRIDEGLVLLKPMLRKNMVLDTIAYSLFVFSKVKTGDLDAAKEVYHEMLNRGFKENAFVCGLFVGAYSKEGRIDEAIGLLEEMGNLGLRPSDETLNQVIEGCSLNGRFEDAFGFCKKMLTMGVLPSSSAVNEMFEKLCEVGKTKQADEMFTVLLDKGFPPNGTTYSLLIQGYSKDGDIEVLTKLLFEMDYRSVSPNMLGFTSSIISFCNFGRLNDAEKYLKLMKTQSFTPCSDVYKELIGGHLQRGNKARARELHREMLGRD